MSVTPLCSAECPAVTRCSINIWGLDTNGTDAFSGKSQMVDWNSRGGGRWCGYKETRFWASKGTPHLFSFLFFLLFNFFRTTRIFSNLSSMVVSILVTPEKMGNGFLGSALAHDLDLYCSEMIYVWTCLQVCRLDWMFFWGHCQANGFLIPRQNVRVTNSHLL